MGSLRHSGWKLAGQRSQQMRVPPCEQRKHLNYVIMVNYLINYLIKCNGQHQLALTCIPCLDCFDDDEEDFDDFDLPAVPAAAAAANRAIGSLGSEVC